MFCYTAQNVRWHRLMEMSRISVGEKLCQFKNFAGLALRSYPLDFNAPCLLWCTREGEGVYFYILVGAGVRWRWWKWERWRRIKTYLPHASLVRKYPHAAYRIDRFSLLACVRHTRLERREIFFVPGNSNVYSLPSSTHDDF